MISGNLANELQVWGLEENFIIFQDGSLGFGLSASPIDASCLLSEDINSIATRLDQFLNGLPPNIDLQFVQDINGGKPNRGILAKYLNAGRQAKDKVAKDLAFERVQKFKYLDKVGALPYHDLKIFLRCKAPSTFSQKPKFFSRNENFPKMTDGLIEKEIHNISRIQTDVLGSLKSLGMDVEVLPADEVIQLMYAQWNPTRPLKIKKYDAEDIRSSILFTDVSISEKGFSLRDMHHRVISLKILPEMTFSSMSQTLRELPFDSRLFLTIHVPDQQKEITKLQTQRRLAFSMARGKRSGVSDIESEAKFQDLESLLNQMLAQGEKVFHVSFNILLRSTSEEDLENQVALALSKIRELSGAEGMIESLASFDIFKEFSIPNCRAKDRVKSLKTTTLSDFLPIYGPWRGHREPSILLRSRMGSFVKFDPFSLTNYNQLISGGSGIGKSFSANLLLLQLMRENPKVFIVDIGGSYKKITEHLSGQFVPLGADSSVAINPFDLSPGDTKPKGEKIKFLLSLVEIISKEDGEARLGKLARAEIEEAIQECYATSQSPRLSVLREILLNHRDPAISRYGKILAPWCGDSPYGRFLDTPTTLSLQKNLVAFDLKGLENHPDLQAVCLFIITDFVWREIQPQRLREQKKILIFDECWRLLENEAGSQFIGEVFRTFRKYRAGVVAISQDMEDFAKSKVSQAILSNSATKWILRQRGANQARLKEILQLNDSEMDLITSLRQERGVYSEAFLMAEGQKTVVMIESTPLEYWLATTDAKDIAALDRCVWENPDLTKTEILYKMAQLYPSGFIKKDGAK